MLVPSGEKIAETKPCKSCGIEFHITDRDIEFLDKVAPTFAGRKEPIPTPTLCPDCRACRRLSWRNERKLYKRKCDSTGKDIVSVYSPDKPYKVYEQSVWWGDGWDPLSYGREFDFSRTFAEQYAELLLAVPRPSILNRESENSEYTQTCLNNKNSYMLFESSFNEDCLFGYWVHENFRTVDCSFSPKCRYCYDNIDCAECEEVFHSQNCRMCSRSSYLLACEGCQDCFGASNLVNARYVFLDERLDETSYRACVEEFRRDPAVRARTLARMAALRATAPRQASVIHESEDCTGDYIRNAARCHECYYAMGEVADCKYVCNALMHANDVMDADTAGVNASMIYDSMNTAVDVKGMLFCIRSWTCSECVLANECDFSSRLFGCIGLRHKQYCILNKQYTEAEYNALVPRIIEHMRKTGEWGEFLSPSLSLYGYDETVAMEHYPLTREQALAQGFKWSDYEAPFPAVSKIIPGAKLPENISDVPDDILNWAIECEVTRKPFRIIKQELEFYRKHSLPIPRRHPDQRHLDRLALRNPRKLYERTCDNCAKDIVTTYAPDRPERVYCEECYRQEVYG